MKANDITTGNQYTLSTRFGNKDTVTVIHVNDRKQPLGQRRSSDFIDTVRGLDTLPEDAYFHVLDEDATVAIVGFNSCATAMGRQVHFINPRRLSELV